MNEVHPYLDVDDEIVLEVVLAEEGLAGHEVGVGEVGQGLQEDLRHDLKKKDVQFKFITTVSIMSYL